LFSPAQLMDISRANLQCSDTSDRADDIGLDMGDGSCSRVCSPVDFRTIEN
jgi:hypothetical protein